MLIFGVQACYSLPVSYRRFSWLLIQITIICSPVSGKHGKIYVIVLVPGISPTYLSGRFVSALLGTSPYCTGTGTKTPRFRIALLRIYVFPLFLVIAICAVVIVPVWIYGHYLGLCALRLVRLRMNTRLRFPLGLGPFPCDGPSRLTVLVLFLLRGSVRPRQSACGPLPGDGSGYRHIRADGRSRGSPPASC